MFQAWRKLLLSSSSGIDLNHPLVFVRADCLFPFIDLHSLDRKVFTLGTSMATESPITSLNKPLDHTQPPSYNQSHSPSMTHHAVSNQENGSLNGFYQAIHKGHGPVDVKVEAEVSSCPPRLMTGPRSIRADLSRARLHPCRIMVPCFRPMATFSELKGTLVSHSHRHHLASRWETHSCHGPKLAFPD